MTHQSGFRTQEEEVVRLLEECTELRRTLKTISSQISRIETRVKVAFPSAAAKHKERQVAQSEKIESSLSTEQALAEFDHIARLASSETPSDAASYLARQSAADLFVIAKELGVTFPHSKPSVRAVQEAILGKARESMLLSKHSRRE